MVCPVVFGQSIVLASSMPPLVLRLGDRIMSELLSGLAGERGATQINCSSLLQTWREELSYLVSFCQALLLAGRRCRYAGHSIGKSVNRYVGEAGRNFLAEAICFNGSMA